MKVTAPGCFVVPMRALTLVGFGFGMIGAALAGSTISVEVQDVRTQTGYGTSVGGFTNTGYGEYSIVTKIDTGGLSLSVAPTVVTPGGTTLVFPVGSGNSPTWATGSGGLRYQYGNAWASEAALNAALGSGNFKFVMGGTTNPKLSLDTSVATISSELPATPLLTGSTTGVWSGSTLLVDSTVTNTFYFNSSDFTAYGTSATCQISATLYSASGYPAPCTAQVTSQSGSGRTDSALTSYSVASGTMVAGQTYYLQINYTQLLSMTTGAAVDYFGAGYSGNVTGLSYVTSTTFVAITAVPEPATTGLLAGLSVLGLLAVRRRRR